MNCSCLPRLLREADALWAPLAEPWQQVVQAVGSADGADRVYIAYGRIADNPAARRAVLELFGADPGLIDAIEAFAAAEESLRHGPDT